MSCYTADGEQWKRHAWVDLRDARQQDDTRRSDSTLVRVRWDPENQLLTLDGNMGRFGRRDNAWGESVWHAGWNFLDHLAKHHRLRLQADPAVKRVDLTANVLFENAREAYAYIQWAAGIKLGRAQPHEYPTGVAWVTENWSAKVYDKLADLRRHKHHELAAIIEEVEGYMLRLELTLRTDELARNGLDTLSKWQESEDAMTVIFTDKFRPLNRGGAVIDEAHEHMPNRLTNALEAWRNGRNFLAALHDGQISRATYYRLRKELLQYGYDISQPCNVTRMRIKPREVNYRFAPMPEWYSQMISRDREAA